MPLSLNFLYLQARKMTIALLWVLLAAAATLHGAVEVPIDVDEVIGIQAAVVHPAPVYTKIALQLKLQGHVGIGAYIAKDGSVYDTVIAFGNPVLVQMAVDAVKQWRFKPFANDRGEPAKAYVRLTFDLQPPSK
jgi:TonB family protein